MRSTNNFSNAILNAPTIANQVVLAIRPPKSSRGGDRASGTLVVFADSTCADSALLGSAGE